MKKNQPRSRQFLNAEKVQLLAELAVVALFGLVELPQVVVQLFLCEECRAVDALQLLVVLVTLPIRAGD